jgi:hypothetical protein
VAKYVLSYKGVAYFEDFCIVECDATLEELQKWAKEGLDVWDKKPEDFPWERHTHDEEGGSGEATPEDEVTVETFEQWKDYHADGSLQGEPVAVPDLPVTQLERVDDSDWED